MRRRAFLTVGATALAATAGCLDDIGDTTGGDGSDEDRTDDTTTDPTTDPDDGETYEPSEDGDHYLYVENLDDETHLLDLVVVEASSGETVLAGRYEAPDGRGMEFPDLAAWDETYEVTASLVDAGVTETFFWSIDDCTGSMAPNGSRNGSVRIAEDAAELSFVVDACDALVAGGAVSTGPASNFRVAGATPSVDPTPGFTRGCPPMLDVSQVDEGTSVPDPSVVEFQAMPENRQAEFERALADEDNYIELDDPDYGYWVDEAEFVAYEGHTYGVTVAVC